jgi:hypothetical protein
MEEGPLMDMSWGPIHKATTEGKGTGEEGAVLRHSANGGFKSPSHSVNYDATDSRHGHERDMMGWPSIDHNSGPVTEHDWEHSTGHFPDGPGVWRQT